MFPARLHQPKRQPVPFLPEHGSIPVPFDTSRSCSVPEFPVPSHHRVLAGQPMPPNLPELYHRERGR